MDKPISMSVKNFLIRKLSVDMMIPEKTIEAVVNHQFSKILDIMQENDSIEISGLGKFVFLPKKAQRYMNKWLRQKEEYEGYLADENITEEERKQLSLRLEAIISNIEYLKARRTWNTE